MTGPGAVARLRGYAVARFRQCRATAQPRNRVTTLVLSLLFTLPLAASTITGRITSGGRAVAGATVTLTSDVLQHPRVTRTGSYGTYWLTALPPGSYEITFSAKGMQTIIRRATIELARVARADAVLEPSEDEETVTSTARTISVLDTTAVTTHFSDFVLDRLPTRRDPFIVGELAPGPPNSFVSFDGDAHVAGPLLLGEEPVEQITDIRAAAPLEHSRSHGDLIVMRTRSGSNDFFLALRDSITSNEWFAGDYEGDGAEHFLEATTGGRIVRDRLWFFAAGWSGEDAFFPGAARGYLAKLTAQIGASHNLVGTFVDTNHDFDLILPDNILEKRITAIHYTGALSPRTTLEASASRIADRLLRRRPVEELNDEEVVSGKATYVLPAASGDHVITAGGSVASTFADFFGVNDTMLFLNDRWAAGPWVIEVGVRRRTFPEERYQPRLAAAYVLPGSGRHVLSATYGRYNDPRNIRETRQLTAGYAYAIGSSGSVRADVIHSSHGAAERLAIEIDAAYRLFDRLTTGANYAFDEDDILPPRPRHSANAWLAIDFPLGEHVVGVTALQRYRSSYASTDVALRYRLPAGRTQLTLAADVTNVFDTGEFEQLPRALRLWARLRL